MTLGYAGEARALEPLGGLVVVHAHPDDETLATGALLATWAASGQAVTVVTCTRGERGEVIDTVAHPTGLGGLEGDGPALAAYREGELARALVALGVTDHVFLDTVVPDDGAPERYEDSGMAWVAPGIAGAVSRAAEDGSHRAFVGYGHPDHVRTHQVTVRALELAAQDNPDDPAGEPALWCVVQPAAAVRAARRALAASPAVPALTLPDPEERVLPPVATWGSGEPGTLVAVPLRPVLDRVARALRAHATQVQAVTVTPEADGEALVGWYALSNDVLAPLLGAEHYATFPSRPGAAGTVTP